MYEGYAKCYIKIVGEKRPLLVQESNSSREARAHVQARYSYPRQIYKPVIELFRMKNKTKHTSSNPQIHIIQFVSLSERLNLEDWAYGQR